MKVKMKIITQMSNHLKYEDLKLSNQQAASALQLDVSSNKECPFNGLLSKKLELLTGGEGGSLVELKVKPCLKLNLLWCAMSRFRIFDNLIISMCM